ncbi:hypothetical protein MAJ_07764, partial [Metarhizium majus ARSEF 297]
MLSTLLVASAAVASASLDRRFEFTTQEGISRIGGAHAIDDACHPAWNFDTCNTDKLQPPCPAAQGLAMSCEHRTKGYLATATYEERKAYQDCLLGNDSAYPAVERGCIECKVANGWFTKEGGEYLMRVFQRGYDTFKNDNSSSGPLWNAINKDGIDWNRVNNPRRNVSATPVGMEEYWSNPVRDLKVGRYTLNGTTYGGDLDCDNGETEACSGDDMDEESAAVPESPIEAQDPIGHLETEIVSIQGEIYIYIYI